MSSREESCAVAVALAQGAGQPLPSSPSVEVARLYPLCRHAGQVAAVCPRQTLQPQSKPTRRNCCRNGGRRGDPGPRTAGPDAAGTPGLLQRHTPVSAAGGWLSTLSRDGAALRATPHPQGTDTPHPASTFESLLVTQPGGGSSGGPCVCRQVPQRCPA